MSRLVLLLGALLVLLAPWLSYSGADRNGFVYDDRVAIERNERVHSTARIGEIWRTEYWNRRELPSRLYRPLPLTTFAYEWERSGGAAASFHRTNVWMHGATSLILYLVLGSLLSSVPLQGSRRLPRRVAGHRGGAPILALPWSLAGLTALVFALHPLHSETVLAIVGRAEILATALGLLSILAARAARGSGDAMRPVIWTAASVAVALACLAKESAFLFLPLAALAGAADLHPTGAQGFVARRSWGDVIGSALLGALPLLPGVLVAGILRLAVLSSIRPPVLAFADNWLVDATFAERIAAPFRIVTQYVLLHLWPQPLVPDYSFDALPGRGWGFWLSALLGVVLSLGVFAWGWVRGVRSADPLVRLAALGCGWCLVGFLAASNLFFLLGTIFAERLAYLPGIGLMLLLAAALAALARSPQPWGRPGLALVAAGLVVAAVIHVGIARARTEAWRSNLTLFEQAAKDQPRSFRVWTGLGEALMDAGRPDEALPPLRRALAIYDGFGATHSCLMSIYYDRGELDAARRHAERLRAIVPVDAKPCFVLADLAFREGRLDDARREAEAGQKLDPDYLPLELVLGRVASAERNDEAAAVHLGRVLRENPQLTAARRELGPVLVRLGRWDEAIETFRPVVETEPDWSSQNYLAWSLLQRVRTQAPTDRDLQLGQAEVAARASVATAPPEQQRYPLDTLAEILAERGVREAAASIFRQLAAAHPSEPKYRERLRALYR